MQVFTCNAERKTYKSLPIYTSPKTVSELWQKLKDTHKRESEVRYVSSRCNRRI